MQFFLQQSVPSERQHTRSEWKLFEVLSIEGLELRQLVIVVLQQQDINDQSVGSEHERSNENRTEQGVRVFPTLGRHAGQMHGFAEAVSICWADVLDAAMFRSIVQSGFRCDAVQCEEWVCWYMPFDHELHQQRITEQRRYARWCQHRAISLVHIVQHKHNKQQQCAFIV